MIEITTMGAVFVIGVSVGVVVSTLTVVGLIKAIGSSEFLVKYLRGDFK